MTVGMLTGITYECPPQRLKAARRHIAMRLHVTPERAWSLSALDTLSGLHDGYSAHLLTPHPQLSMRTLGKASLGCVLGALKLSDRLARIGGRNQLINIPACPPGVQSGTWPKLRAISPSALAKSWSLQRIIRIAPTTTKIVRTTRVRKLIPSSHRRTGTSRLSDLQLMSLNDEDTHPAQKFGAAGCLGP